MEAESYFLSVKAINNIPLPLADFKELKSVFMGSKDFLYLIQGQSDIQIHFYKDIYKHIHKEI